MKVLYFIILFAISSSCALVSHSHKKRIVGGDRVEISKHPYIAQYIENDEQVCAATIISLYWLLTAAHCVDKVDNLFIKIGSSNTKFIGKSVDGLDYKIRDIVIHSNYNHSVSGNQHDVALLKLAKPIRLNKFSKPIRISRKPPKAGDELLIIGYGQESLLSESSPVLKSATVPVIDFEVCKNQYHSARITGNMFCAGTGGIDTCIGDSGGPAVINGKLVGITSFGRECAKEEYAGVYIKIYNYLGWITKVTGLIL